MKDKVLIKGNKDGIKLVLNKEIEFNEIISELTNKFKKSKSYFGNSSIFISIEGKNINTNQENEILNTINLNTDLDVLGIISDSTKVGDYKKLLEKRIRNEIETKFNKEINLKKEKKPVEQDSVMYYYGTLRSGQLLKNHNDIIILGDVNSGSEVEAGGNVIVFGKLKGVVYAGLNGNDKSYIAAVEMKPLQLRINNAYGRAADEDDMIEGISPKIAYLQEGLIVIDDINNKAFKEMFNKN